jgi:hypothetical protein
VRRYLEDKFGEDWKAARSAMQKLAKAYKPQGLARDAYRLYERFRPDMPAGKKGWGAKGDLDLGLRAAGEGETLIVAGSCPAAGPRHHFFLACLDWILPFCNFFRRLGNLVAGFLAVRLAFFAMTCTPSNQAVPLPAP